MRKRTKVDLRSVPGARSHPAREDARLISAFFAGVDEMRLYLDRHIHDPRRRRERLADMCARLPALRSAHALGFWLTSSLHRVLGGRGCGLRLWRDVLAGALQEDVSAVRAPQVASLYVHLARVDAAGDVMVELGPGASVPHICREPRDLDGYWSWLQCGDAPDGPEGVLVPLVALDGPVGLLWLAQASALDAASVPLVDALASTAAMALQQAMRRATLTYDPRTHMLTEAAFERHANEAIASARHGAVLMGLRHRDLTERHDAGSRGNVVAPALVQACLAALPQDALMYVREGDVVALPHGAGRHTTAEQIAEWIDGVRAALEEVDASHSPLVSAHVMASGKQGLRVALGQLWETLSVATRTRQD